MEHYSVIIITTCNSCLLSLS